MTEKRSRTRKSATKRNGRLVGAAETSGEDEIMQVSPVNLEGM